MGDMIKLKEILIEKKIQIKSGDTVYSGRLDNNDKIDNWRPVFLL